jgi:5-(carboxyamino)imidazole ribonucleotide mutase
MILRCIPNKATDGWVAPIGGSFDNARLSNRAQEVWRRSMTERQAVVGIIMGSQSDWATLRAGAEILDQLEVPYEARIISAHRTPGRMADYAASARERGLLVIIAGAGGAAHLPGMVAAQTTLPVFGVPVESKALNGLDSLLSIVQMPGGIPVGTMAIGRAGATNAALLAAAVIGLGDARVLAALEAWRRRQTEAVAEAPSDEP